MSFLACVCCGIYSRVTLMSAGVVTFHENNSQSYLTGTSRLRGWCKLEIQQLSGITTHFCCVHPSSEAIIYGSGHAQLPFTTAIMISKWHFADLFMAEGRTFVAKCWNQAPFRGNWAFWPHHWVCCNFAPEDKCQAWIFVLRILYIFLKNVSLLQVRK